MAQNSEQSNEISLQRAQHQQIGDSIDSQDKVLSQKAKAIFPTIKSNSKDKELKSRFERITPNRASKTSTTNPLAENSIQIASQKFQPSKAFAQKCLVELQSTLESIKVDYHEEIKKLYLGEDSRRYTDLTICIGEKFEKSIHKCIIASRAYKFYCALKLFRKPEEKENILIEEFVAHNNLEDQKPNDNTEELSPEELIAKQLKERQLKEALESIECNLPEDLIDIEVIQNFIRRAYFDQDLLTEETQLNKQLIDWLKENRPDLILQTNKNKTKTTQPDYRESFRTINQNFEQISLAERTTSPIHIDLSTATDSVIERSTESKMDQQESLEENSQTTSLTRTETFELISKSDNNSSLAGSNAPPTGASSILTDDEENRKSTANDSGSSDAYAPTTRTGLKPKKFTTPVGLKVATSRSKQTTSGSCSSGDTTTSISKLATQDHIGSVKKSTLANRKSSGVETCSDASPKSSTSLSSTSKTKNSPQIGKGTSTRPTVITRAHPISLERSHSPASAQIKPKNFIAANKKLVSQMEKKIASAMAIATSSTSTLNPNSNDQTTNSPLANYDSDNETSDASFMATEPLTTDNLAAQLDRFTLVSYSKLADALSKMLIGEILTDTIVLTNGGNKQIRAHKCILAARSAYLNDIINKPLASHDDQPEGKQNLKPFKIDLDEYSYPAVYFSIIHIYSGIVKVPQDLELEELAKLSNLLHVGTLRQVCIHNLRMNYCHYFHKPCQLCCVGVLKTLPLAWRYDYTELYSHCLQWIGSHFAQIFCLEEFSNLKPQDLIEECYKATLNQLTSDNIIQKTVECQKLLKSLPRVKWTESIICLVGRQLEDFCHYVADNYEKILQTEAFLSLGKSCWECEVLEENLLAAMNHLKPDSGCKTLIQLDKIECSIEPFGSETGFASGRNVSESFANLVAKMRKYCERYLLKEAAAVVHCSSWRQMHPSLQRRIKDQALLSNDFDEPTKNLTSKPRLPSMVRQQGSRLSPSSPQPQSPSGTTSPSNKPTSDSASKLKSPNVTYLPPPKNKPATARHVKILK